MFISPLLSALLVLLCSFAVQPQTVITGGTLIDVCTGKEIKTSSIVIHGELKAVSAASFSKRQKFVGLCSQAGVRIITGTDGAGLGIVLPGFGLHHELKMLNDAGMSPSEVLRAATLTSAEALGRAQDLGSIEEGKYADFLILEKDPLADIGNLNSIQIIFKGGRRFDPQALMKDVKIST